MLKLGYDIWHEDQWHNLGMSLQALIAAFWWCQHHPGCWPVLWRWRDPVSLEQGFPGRASSQTWFQVSGHPSETETVDRPGFCAESTRPNHHGVSGKGKERKSIYIAPFRTKVHPKCSGMDHTVLPANNTMPAFQEAMYSLEKREQSFFRDDRLWYSRICAGKGR